MASRTTCAFDSPASGGWYSATYAICVALKERLRGAREAMINIVYMYLLAKRTPWDIYISGPTNITLHLG
jgi:hypothetical protein